MPQCIPMPCQLNWLHFLHIVYQADACKVVTSQSVSQAAWKPPSLFGLSQPGQHPW